MPSLEPQGQTAPIRLLSNVFPISFVLKIRGRAHMSRLFFRTWMMLYRLSGPNACVNPPPHPAPTCRDESCFPPYPHSSFFFLFWLLILYLLLLWDSAKMASCFSPTCLNSPIRLEVFEGRDYVVFMHFLVKNIIFEHSLWKMNERTDIRMGEMIKRMKRTAYQQSKRRMHLSRCVITFNSVLQTPTQRAKHSTY